MDFKFLYSEIDFLPFQKPNYLDINIIFDVKLNCGIVCSSYFYLLIQDQVLFLAKLNAQIYFVLFSFSNFIKWNKFIKRLLLKMFLKSCLRKSLVSK